MSPASTPSSGMSAATFSGLTYRGQVGRLRRLARAALPRFSVPADAPLQLLNHGENATFRVAHAGREHVLRIHRVDYQSPANIRSELAWLRALRRDTDLDVPLPVADADGAVLQRVGHPGVPGERSCVLLEWIPGRFASAMRGRLYWERLGTLMGGLHAHARTWQRPPDFDRRAWDAEGLMGARPLWGSPEAAPGLTAEDRRLLERARAQATAEILALGQSAETWGLIHADLHPGNVLVREGHMCAIDFDDCGDGWFLYDILVAAGAFLFGRPDYRRRLGWFLRTYRERSPLDEAHLEAMEAFLVARRIAHLGWISSRADNPRLAQYVDGARNSTRRVLTAYVQR